MLLASGCQHFDAIHVSTLVPTELKVGLEGNCLGIVQVQCFLVGDCHALPKPLQIAIHERRGCQVRHQPVVAGGDGGVGHTVLIRQLASEGLRHVGGASVGLGEEL